MMTYKSFVDLLFILLLSTLVMLTQTVQLGAVDTAVAKLGSGAISPVKAHEVQVVAVGETTLQLEGETHESLDDVVTRLDGRAVLLITAEIDVRHHRVLEVWSTLVDRGLDVKLGAKPVREEA